jgi:hypothetical protein
MRATFLIQRWFPICTATLLAVLLSPMGVAESPDNRIESILLGPGDLQADDKAFLQRHPKELVSFAERFLVEAGLGRREDALERAPLLRLIGLLGTLTDFSASKLEHEILARLVGIAARGRSDTAKALCKVLLQADDSALMEIGIEVSAERYPELLVTALDRGDIHDKEEAVVRLAMNGVKPALPLLRRIAEEAPEESDLKTVARLAIARIEGKELPDRYDKSTPQKFAHSFVALAKKNPQRYTEEEMEFWINPMLDGAVEQWREYVASPPSPKKDKDTAQRLEMAKGLERALKEGDKAFVVRARECRVSVGGTTVVRLHQDMFAQWRIIRSW